MESFATIPDSVKRLRACKRCKLLKAEPQWLSVEVGFCDNCPHPESGGKDVRAEWMESNTTPLYTGFVRARFAPPPLPPLSHRAKCGCISECAHCACHCRRFRAVTAPPAPLLSLVCVTCAASCR